jgi:hypothetical protein
MKVWKRLVPILAITSLMIAAKPSSKQGSIDCEAHNG